MPTGKLTPEASEHRALVLSLLNEQAMESHEKICAERYENIHSSIEEIKQGNEKIWGIMWKAGVGGFSLLLTILGFLTMSLLTANQQTQRAIQVKQDLMQQQLLESRAHPPQPTAPPP
jgi:hypothetical protein